VIDWAHFTPWSSFAGGLLIGLAAAMLVLFNGRIAGISGIAGGLLTPQRADIGWRVAFLLGLLLAPVAFRLFGRLPFPRIDAGFGTLLIAGLLVGIGTSYGSGCTSGHGVCGLGRFSLRSLVAVMVFMATGMAATFVMRHVL
jgi:uncharacterized membrane protein YedE/YeeE